MPDLEERIREKFNDLGDFTTSKQIRLVAFVKDEITKAQQERDEEWREKIRKSFTVQRRMVNDVSEDGIMTMMYIPDEASNRLWNSFCDIVEKNRDALLSKEGSTE